MPVWYEIHFEETGEKVDWYGVAGYYYIFEDGSKLEFLIAPAWCVHCQGIVGVEPMPSLSDLENYLDELLNPNSQIN